jgi:hypothetical protein
MRSKKMADVRRDKDGKPIRARAPRATRAPKAKVLATLSPEECFEYFKRRTLVEDKQREFLAAGSYVDAMTADLVDKYDLPIHFDLDLETGVVKEVTS